MLTFLPLLLALVGTVLMAIVIFAPLPDAPVTVSFAPPAAPTLPAEHWVRSAADRWEHTPERPPDATFAPRFYAEDTFAREPVPRPVAWPAFVDGCAGECDAGARSAIVGALRSVGGPWADGVLRRALADEPDELIREAIVAALAIPAA